MISTRSISLIPFGQFSNDIANLNKQFQFKLPNSNANNFYRYQNNTNWIKIKPIQIQILSDKKGIAKQR